MGIEERRSLPLTNPPLDELVPSDHFSRCLVRSDVCHHPGGQKRRFC